MLSPTTRTMHITYFRVLCVDTERQSIVYKDFRLYRFERDIAKLLKYVQKQGLVSAPLIPKRVVDIKCVDEIRTLGAQEFYNHSKLLKEYYHNERLKD